jgi:hypothetical protein
MVRLRRVQVSRRPDPLVLHGFLVSTRLVARQIFLAATGREAGN